ncbi:hypothetical protein HELRODRAFT_195149 [Helobdella robusta]|uniref:Uncharacterized protein n=1 Tax=Helobdella robusta TaxID=6412 RepID=T1FWT3_HELRO|nr:hypothetical protein HELRODRAFT_195149 [Helobdella robusta]ESO08255.1 hypothetical protein HELRODRAFT_195149 [Helobdella robusta]
MQHLVLSLKIFIAYAIPDIPDEVAEERARLEFMRREALKDNNDMNINNNNNNNNNVGNEDATIECIVDVSDADSTKTLPDNSSDRQQQQQKNAALDNLLDMLNFKEQLS